DYYLMNLSDLEKFIIENNHLPEISPAVEMETEKGYPVGKLSSQLLQKIEEIILYTIQQEHLLKEQGELLKEQGELIKEMKEEIEKLKGLK
ncbi:MAG: hypothetical protein ACQESN_11100, partial [Thermotogota bacterium]